MSSFLYRVLCGFFLGISIFAPGVSGSVIAVMMGIYTRLLDVVADPLKDIKKNLRYLFPMGIGAVISLVLFVLVFSYLFETYAKATLLLFIGLIAGNLPVVFKDAVAEGFKKRYLVGTVAAFAFALAVGILGLAGAQTGESFVAITVPHIAAGGAVAGACSMMPGMSVSMMLMLVGVYEPVLQGAKALLSLDMTVLTKLLVFVGCFLVALIAFSRLTKWVFKKVRALAYCFVFGFMCGSLIGIFLKMLRAAGSIHWAVGALMVIIGLGISLLFMRLSERFHMED